MRAASRHSSRMPVAKSAVTYPKENQRKQEEEVEEGRKDERSKRSSRGQKTSLGKEGKQETKKTRGRLVGDAGHPVPSATSHAPGLSASKLPNPSRTISPSWPSSQSDLPISQHLKEGKGKKAWQPRSRHSRTQTHSPSWNERPLEMAHTL